MSAWDGPRGELVVLGSNGNGFENEQAAGTGDIKASFMTSNIEASLAETGGIHGFSILMRHFRLGRRTPRGLLGKGHPTHTPGFTKQKTGPFHARRPTPSASPLAKHPFGSETPQLLGTSFLNITPQIPHGTISFPAVVRASMLPIILRRSRAGGRHD